MLIRPQIIILILALILASCTSDNKEKLYSLAFDLEENEQYAKAIKIHDKILEKNPNFRPSLINRGASKAALGDYEGAIKDYKKILEFDSDNLLAMMNIGNNYENLNDFKSSITYYTEALKSKELIKSGEFYAQLELNTDFDKDYQYRVYDYEVLFERGTAYMHNNEYMKAISDLNSLIETGKMVGDAYFYIGECYLRMDDTLSACENFDLSKKYGISEAIDRAKDYCE